MAGLVSIIPLPQRTWLAFQFQTDRCGLEAGRGDSAWQEQNRTNGKTTGPSERFPTTKQHCELEPSAGTPKSRGELGSAPSTQGPPLGAGCWVLGRDRAQDKLCPSPPASCHWAGSGGPGAEWSAHTGAGGRRDHRGERGLLPAVGG